MEYKINNKEFIVLPNAPNPQIIYEGFGCDVIMENTKQNELTEKKSIV